MENRRDYDFPLKEDCGEVYGEDHVIFGKPHSFNQVVPGAGSLVDHMDKRIFVWLRDGRKYVGILRSVDIFANLMLQNAYERIQIDDHYADLTQGVIIVRGENVALLGEVGNDLGIQHLPDDLLAVQAARDTKKEKMDRLQVQAYFKRGMIYTPEDYF